MPRRGSGLRAANWLECSNEDRKFFDGAGNSNSLFQLKTRTSRHVIASSDSFERQGFTLLPVDQPIRRIIAPVDGYQGLSNEDGTRIGEGLNPDCVSVASRLAEIRNGSRRQGRKA